MSPTPRQRVLDVVASRLARVPWDHALREQFVDHALEEIRQQARAVSTISALFQIAPFTPKIVRRRLKQRTPHSIRMTRYIDSMTPASRARLVRDAWTKANPRWTLPSP